MPAAEVTFHFASPQQFSQIEMAFSRSNERTFKYDILVSTDKVNWTPIVTNAESALTEGGYDWQYTPFAQPVTAKYVKYIGKGNSGSNANNLVEIKFKK